MILSVENLCVTRGGGTLLDRLSLSLEPGSITVLAGPNGAGKSTLLETLAGDLPPTAGQIRLDGQRITDLSLPRRAELRTMLRQQSLIAFDFAVTEVVAMGLHPHGISADSPHGRALIAEALADMDLSAFADRSATRLSGGEGQRVHIARSLVQLRAGEQRSLLLLDEPTTGLDYRHQLALLQVLKAEAQAGATIIASLHDLPLACRLATRLLLLARGTLLADVPPEQLDPALVADVYAIDPAEAALLLGLGRSPLPLRLAAE
ncbi:ATP-binding cassette domain-containing protein [Sandaracinobacter neustonicus]|nr:ATP-binding cassette domain-containing protein [Sandaracinobacter neustonicus]